jgi:multidrug resistance efflux pump
MTINQPQEDIKVEGAEAKKLDAVRNQITLGEAEVSRLKDLVRAETYTVGQLTNSKVALTQEVEDLESKLDVVKKTLEERKKELLQKETEVENAKDLAHKVIERVENLERSKQELLKILN